MSNKSETEFLDIEFVDSTERIISIIREYVNKTKTKNIEGFDASTKKFKDLVQFECIEHHLNNTLHPKSIEYINNAHGSLGYLGALMHELGIIFKDSLMEFEYMSLGPCSFFQNVGTLDLRDDYIYYYRNYDEYGNQIFLKQEKRVYDDLVRPVMFQYFKDMSKFNLDISMLSLPSNITVDDHRLNDEGFLKDCFRAFLDNPKEYSDEKWRNEEEDLYSRFEFENNHYKRSMNTLSKLPEMLKEYKENKGTEKIYDETLDTDKERLLKLIMYYKVDSF